MDYEESEIGDKIEIGYLRDGKKMKTTFNKPEVKGGMIIRKDEKK